MDDHVENRRKVRELSESVLKTVLTQIEKQQGNDKDGQYRSLLASRCREFKEYVDTHPIDSLAAANASRPEWLASDPYADLTGQRIQSWLTSSLCPLPVDNQQTQVRRPSIGSTAGRPSSEPNSAVNSLRYKTEMCRSVSEGGGVCRYGDKCQYAHNREELRSVPRHPRYKTQMCREYHLTSVCSYGVRCNFLHDEPKQMERIPSAADDRNEVFSLPGSWSGRSSPELDHLMSRWIGSSEAANREGSTGAETRHSSSSESVSSSPVFISMFSPFVAVIDERYAGSASCIPAGQRVAESSAVGALQKHISSDNVFQFPACFPLAPQINGIAYAYRPLC
jgi:hypothetical protein